MEPADDVDRIKQALDNPRALNYLGLTPERLLELRALWQAGVREVPRVSTPAA